MEDKIKRFYDLEAWKKGHNLALVIYQTTKIFPKEELYGIVSQLRRAVFSITANIAEGFARYHFKDKVRFYYQARGSVVEVQNFLLVAKDLKFIDLKLCKSLGEKANEVARLINGLIKSIKTQNISNK